MYPVVVWRSWILLPYFMQNSRSKYNPRKQLHMMTSSNGNIFRVTGHLCGEFTGHRWILRTKASDAELWCFFYLRLNKRLSKQWWGWWFETPQHPLWRHCNEFGTADTSSRIFTSILLIKCKFEVYQSDDSISRTQSELIFCTQFMKGHLLK